jgi:hypothetical protein
MRRVALCSALGAVALFLVPAASAATPEQIYRDYADNGHLDGTYSRADLNRALKDAVLQGYGNPNVQQGLQQELGSQAGVAGSAGASGGLPFTGLDLTLMAVGGSLLLVTGAGLRRLGKTRR